MVHSNRYNALVLLGAGASYGHEKEVGHNTPPLMRDFLVKGVLSGILDEVDYPQLVTWLKTKAGVEDLYDSCEVLRERGENFEDFMNLLVEARDYMSSLVDDVITVQMQQNRDRIDNLRKKRGMISAEELSYLTGHPYGPNYAFILETTRFFIHSFITAFCGKRANDDSAYVKLAEFIGRSAPNVVGIVTLNYDTIFESALDRKGISYDYKLTETQEIALPLLKPHGSVNFRFPLKSGSFQIINIGAVNWHQYLKFRTTFIEGLKVRNAVPIEVYVPSGDLDRDFFTAPGKPISHVPVIVQPLPDKTYDQFKGYMNIWASLSKILDNTDTVVVIGCKMHDNEIRLWQYLDKYLSKEAAIKIVGNGGKELGEIETRFKKRGFLNTVSLYEVQGFYEYGQGYLRNGRLF